MLSVAILAQAEVTVPIISATLRSICATKPMEANNPVLKRVCHHITEDDVAKIHPKKKKRTALEKQIEWTKWELHPATRSTDLQLEAYSAEDRLYHENMVTKSNAGDNKVSFLHFHPYKQKWVWKAC